MQEVAKEDYLRQAMLDTEQSEKGKGKTRIKIETDKIKYNTSIARLAALEVLKNGKKVDQILHKSQLAHLHVLSKPQSTLENYRVMKHLDNNPFAISTDMQEMRQSQTTTWYNRSFMMNSLLKTHQRLRAKSEETEESQQTRQAFRAPSFRRIRGRSEENTHADSLDRKNKLNRLILPALSITAKRSLNPLRNRDLSKESKKQTKNVNVRKDLTIQNTKKQFFDLEAHMESLRHNRDCCEDESQKSRFFIKKKKNSSRALQDFNDYYMEYPSRINHSLNAVFSIFEDFSPDMTEDKNNIACSISNLLEMANKLDSGGTAMNLELFRTKSIEEEADELQDNLNPLGVGAGDSRALSSSKSKTRNQAVRPGLWSWVVWAARLAGKDRRFSS